MVVSACQDVFSKRRARNPGVDSQICSAPLNARVRAISRNAMQFAALRSQRWVCANHATALRTITISDPFSGPRDAEAIRRRLAIDYRARRSATKETRAAQRARAVVVVAFLA